MALWSRDVWVTGHLDQERFKTFPIEADGHLLALLRYVVTGRLKTGQRWAIQNRKSCPKQFALFLGFVVLFRQCRLPERCVFEVHVLVPCSNDLSTH
ncbi:MAG: hypothetical protein O3A00_03690 [Planctomycetota bacterium]|nr:hypothetical protein [Planctomycetota bacterium]